MCACLWQGVVLCWWGWGMCSSSYYGTAALWQFNRCRFGLKTRVVPARLPLRCCRRSKTQGIALSLGDKLILKQKG